MEPKTRIYSVDFILSLKDKYRDRILHSETIDEFVKLYREIISQDAINPIFSLTTQYSKFPNSKIKRFKKFNNNLYIKSRDAWVPFSNVDDNQKILQAIKITLNKISHKNCDVLYGELLNNLKQYSDIGIMEILATEIYKKAIYDINFQGIYLDICHKLWTNIEWHDNLYSIVASDDEANKLYWYINDKTVDIPKLHGPYKSEHDISDQVRRRINFKPYLINYLQKCFQKRREYINRCFGLKDETESDEKIFKLKRHIFGTVELIGKLYRKKLIPQSIVHVVMLELLCYHQKTLPFEEELEAFSIFWNIIDQGNNIPFKIVMIHQYFSRLKEIQRQSQLSTRINFLVEELFKKYSQKYDQVVLIEEPTSKTKNEVDINTEDLVYQYLKSKDLKTTLDTILNSNSNSNNSIESVVGDIYYIGCENPDEVESLGRLWSGLDQKGYFGKVNLREITDKFMENISDIEVDCPNARKTMKLILEAFDIKIV